MTDQTTTQNQEQNRKIPHRVMLSEDVFVVLRIPETMTPAEFHALMVQSRRIFKISPDAEMTMGETEEIPAKDNETKPAKRNRYIRTRGNTLPVRYDPATGKKWRVFSPKFQEYMEEAARRGDVTNTEVIAAYHANKEAWGMAEIPTLTNSQITARYNHIILERQRRISSGNTQEDVRDGTNPA